MSALPLFLAAFAASSSALPPGSEGSVPTSEVIVVGEDARLQLVGAAERSDAPGAVLRFSSAGVRLRARGTLRLVWADQTRACASGTEAIPDNPPNGIHDDSDARFEAVIETVADTRSRHIVEVRDGDTLTVPELSTITVLKATEALFGGRRLLAIEVGPIDGLPPVVEAIEPPRRTLVVLGDSWATGFGVRGDLPDPVTGVAGGPTCPFTQSTQDVRDAWPLILGESLDVDFAVVAWSGRGLLRDYDGDEGPTTVPEWWASSTVHPDVTVGVVVALGHNDGVTGLPDEGRFRAAWAQTRSSLRQRLGADVPIAVLLPDFQDAPPAIDRTAAFRRLLAADDVILVQEPRMPIALGQGCVWHPGTRAQADFARQLVPLLQGPLHLP